MPWSERPLHRQGSGVGIVQAVWVCERQYNCTIYACLFAYAPSMLPRCTVRYLSLISFRRVYPPSVSTNFYTFEPRK